jgi:hypothetical protein
MTECVTEPPLAAPAQRAEFPTRMTRQNAREMRARARNSRLGQAPARQAAGKLGGLPQAQPVTPPAAQPLEALGGAEETDKALC